MSLQIIKLYIRTYLKNYYLNMAKKGLGQLILGIVLIIIAIVIYQLTFEASGQTRALVMFGLGIVGFILIIKGAINSIRGR